MRRVGLRPEATNYVRDNEGLIPDVLAGILLIRDSNKPIGEVRANFRILEVMNHWIYYKWFSKDYKEVLLIKPKG